MCLLNTFTGGLEIEFKDLNKALHMGSLKVAPEFIVFHHGSLMANSREMSAC